MGKREAGVCWPEWRQLQADGVNDTRGSSRCAFWVSHCKVKMQKFIEHMDSLTCKWFLKLQQYVIDSLHSEPGVIRLIAAATDRAAAEV